MSTVFRLNRGAIMMAVGVLYILFAVIAGNTDNVSITSLANFADQKQCETARTKIEGALSASPSHTPIFCAPSTAFDTLQNATK